MGSLHHRFPPAQSAHHRYLTSCNRSRLDRVPPSLHSPDSVRNAWGKKRRLLRASFNFIRRIPLEDELQIKLHGARVAAPCRFRTVEVLHIGNKRVPLALVGSIDRVDLVQDSWYPVRMVKRVE